MHLLFFLSSYWPSSVCLSQSHRRFCCRTRVIRTPLVEQHSPLYSALFIYSISDHVLIMASFFVLYFCLLTFSPFNLVSFVIRNFLINFNSSFPPLIKFEIFLPICQLFLFLSPALLLLSSWMMNSFAVCVIRSCRSFAIDCEILSSTLLVCISFSCRLLITSIKPSHFNFTP